MPASAPRSMAWSRGPADVAVRSAGSCVANARRSQSLSSTGARPLGLAMGMPLRRSSVNGDHPRGWTCVVLAASAVDARGLIDLVVVAMAGFAAQDRGEDASQEAGGAGAAGAELGQVQREPWEGRPGCRCRTWRGDGLEDAE